MAIARVELCWEVAADRDQQRSVAGSLCAALVEILQVPHDDPTVLPVVRDASTTVRPRNAGERFTIVTITLYAGRTGKTKQALYKRIVHSLE